MGFVRQNVGFALAILGGVCASQMPEFAQQYRQRIGGAIEELQRVVADFDRDAAQNGLSRVEALETHQRAAEKLFRDRGQSMRTTIARLDTLVRQNEDFSARPPIVQPFVLTYSDATTFNGAWRDFKPAIPMTPAGLSWGAAGFFAAAMLFWLFYRGMRGVWRVSARPRRARPASRGSG